MVKKKVNRERTTTVLSPAELAAQLNLGVRTVRRMTADGQIPCLYVANRRPRYVLEDVVEALRAQRCPESEKETEQSEEQGGRE